MKTVYICTNDSISMDLVISGMEEKRDIIIDELIHDSYVIVIDNNYIIGEVTAAYLKLRHGINSIKKVIE